MFMRLLQVRIKPDSVASLPALYNAKVLPELQKSGGCLYGSLIRSVRHPEECISMTLWDTREHSEAYEQSGIFQKLLQQAESHFSDSLEWRVQLSKDLTLEYSPLQDEPVVNSYRVVSASTDGSVQTLGTDRMYVRILSITLHPGRLEEFAHLYNEQILTTLRSVQGCRYAFLTEGIEERNEVLSVTIWNSKQDADRYELTGIFDQLKMKVQHTFSELYQWRLVADGGLDKRMATSDDLALVEYNVVAGKSFSS